MMVLQIVLALVQVPLALKYLGNEGFGLWALVAQVAIWLQLLDMGMNGALARYLIDFVAEAMTDNLAKCLGTGFRIFLWQGLLVLFAAGGLSLLGAGLFGLAGTDAIAFRNVLVMLGFATFLRFLYKVVAAWLYATQRLDICNWVSAFLSVLEFVAFWLLLLEGWGIYALAWSKVGVTLLGGMLHIWLAVRLTRFPLRMIRTRLDLPMLRRLAGFGAGMFALTLGGLLLTMTQTVLVSKQLGLASAAVWVTAPKLFQIVLQALSRLWDYRIPYLSHLMVDGAKEELITHFTRIFLATAYIGGGALGVVAAINPVFLSIWTRDAIRWEGINDLLMGTGIYLSLLVRCVTDFVLHTKMVGWMPVLMLGEGLLFVTIAMILLPTHGIPGMLLASLLISGLLRLPYAWSKFGQYLALGRRHTLLLGFHAVGGLLLGMGMWTLLRTFATFLPHESSLLHLALGAGLALAVLTPLSWRLVFASVRGVKSPAVS